jgi:hypothetical protein
MPFKPSGKKQQGDEHDQPKDQKKQYMDGPRVLKPAADSGSTQGYADDKGLPPGLPPSSFKVGGEKKDPDTKQEHADAGKYPHDHRIGGMGRSDVSRLYSNQRIVDIQCMHQGSDDQDDAGELENSEYGFVFFHSMEIMKF